MITTKNAICSHDEAAVGKLVAVKIAKDNAGVYQLKNEFSVLISIEHTSIVKAFAWFDELLIYCPFFKLQFVSSALKSTKAGGLHWNLLNTGTSLISALVIKIARIC